MRHVTSARALAYELRGQPKRRSFAAGPADSEESRWCGPGQHGVEFPPSVRPGRSVLLANRHRPTLRGMQQGISRRGFTVCATCLNAPDAVEAAAAKRPAICVLDVDLPGGGLAAAAAIALHPGSPRIVMVAPELTGQELFAALRAGATGYLVEGIRGDELADALELVAGGEAVLAPRALTLLVEDFRVQRRRGAGELTGREREILLLLGRHLTTKQIALQLGIDPTTVRRHLASALRKLGVPNRQAALDLLERVQRRREHQ